MTLSNYMPYALPLDIMLSKTQEQLQQVNSRAINRKIDNLRAFTVTEVIKHQTRKIPKRN